MKSCAQVHELPQSHCGDIYNNYIKPLYLKMSENINKTTRHLKFRYISILTNLNLTKF